MFRKFKPTRTLFFLTGSKPRPERAPLSNQALVPGVWRLILCVRLTGLQGAHTFGQTLFLWGCFWSNIWNNRLSTAACPPYCGWASFGQWKTWIKKKRWVRGNSCLTVELGHSCFLVFGLKWKHWLFLGLNLASVCLETYTVNSLVLRPLDLNWNYL